jgi:hypothetical protein
VLVLALASGLLALIFTPSAVAAIAMFVLAAACAAVALAWARRRERPAREVPPGALWAGPATVRMVDLLGCPLLDTVVVRRPAAARRHPGRGAPGDLVLDQEGLTWTANMTAELMGVKGAFTLPWTSIVRAQAAPIPSGVPGSGAIAATFGDGSKLDLALSGNYAGFRAALTRLQTPLQGLAE